MRETHGYLEFAVDVAEKQISQPSEECIPKAITRLAEKALCITRRWNKLQRKVKYWGGILSIFSKPLAYQTFNMVSGIIWTASSSHFNSNVFFFGRDLSRWFSWMYNCHPRYAHSSICNWIRALHSGYVAPFLVAYTFLGQCRFGSSHVHVLASRFCEWNLTSSSPWKLTSLLLKLLLEKCCSLI